MALSANVMAQKTPAPAPQTPEGEFAKGIEYYKLGLYSSAGAQFKKAIDMRPKYPEAFFWRGMTLIEMNEYDYAYDSLKNALLLRKDYEEAHYLSWLALEQVGATLTPLAYKELSAVTRKSFDLPWTIHLRLGEALADSGQLDRAVIELRQVASSPPPSVATDSYFVQLSDRNIQFLKDEIAQHTGSYADGHLKLAKAILAKQDYEGAIAEARAAIEQRESFPAAYQFISSVNFMRKDYPHAITTLQDFLAKFPTDSHLGQFRGRISVIRDVAGLPETPVISNPDSAAKFPGLPTLALSDAAKEHKITGSVTIEATLTDGGMIERPIVVQGLGYGLDERAVMAILGSKFEPALKDGKPVAVRQKIQVNFAN
jgi:tetratricopeptide (TPR) repeat protein